MEGSIAIGHLVVESTAGSSPSCRSAYDVLICMPILSPGTEEVIARWYSLKIYPDAVDGEEGSILSVWHGSPPQEQSSYAVLGTDLYCLGGERIWEHVYMPTCIPDVCKFDIQSGEKSMICPRTESHNLVLGGKLYVLPGYPASAPDTPPLSPTDPPPPLPAGTWDAKTGRYVVYRPSSPTAHGGEVFDPITGSWEALPEPPCSMDYHIFSAALENPNRILVGSLKERGGPDFSTLGMFFMYDVQNRDWQVLDPPLRKIDPRCPLGWRGKAVVVGNTLYWITIDLYLLAFDLDSDLWLLGNLKDLNIPFLEFDEPPPPGFIHLEDQRFCMIQRTPEIDLHCVLFDVSPVPEEKTLRISMVSTINYKTTWPTLLTDCLLLGKCFTGEDLQKESAAEAKQEGRS